MRPVIKKLHPKRTNGMYKPYRTAKDELIENLGSYCSFCEIHNNSEDIAVEHVEPKVPRSEPEYKHLQPDLLNSDQEDSELNRRRYHWDNFLLACRTCNSTKSNKEVNIKEVRLPHLHNTFELLKIRQGGVIMIHPNRPPEEQAAMQKTLELVGLVGLHRQIYETKKKGSNRRYLDRFEAWTLAERYLAYYKSEKADTTMILDVFNKRGFWSVWMTVFEEHEEVRQALIANFPGTNASFFETTPQSVNLNSTIG